ncbi:TMEM175 family protein [Microbacterium sp. p3-SID338]|uniref:TMEM175 family protein n=1 Tax=Microbacterium sp. p3-SID338 TaxID=2916214 RepID=UPI0021A76EA1|nr:TMEM175 family protein [Microbacterium sp. p3-SID338]MCT1394667.1 TMEM175 family protein [Microbacterium sp. p3-SID338]
MEAYTDAVIAMAATLLVLDLTAKAIGEVDSDAQLWRALGDVWPSFLSFTISFVLLSGLWVIHMRQWRDIARADLVLLWLNNGRLLFIVLVPFTTSLVDEYSEYFAGRVLLPINFFLAVLFGVATWTWAASRGGHLLAEEAKADAPSQTLGGIVAVVCGAMTVALSPWLGSLAFLTYGLAGPLHALLTRVRRSRGNERAR